MVGWARRVPQRDRPGCRRLLRSGLSERRPPQELASRRGGLQLIRIRQHTIHHHPFPLFGTTATPRHQMYHLCRAIRCGMPVRGEAGRVKGRRVGFVGFSHPYQPILKGRRNTNWNWMRTHSLKAVDAPNCLWQTSNGEFRWQVHHEPPGPKDRSEALTTSITPK